MDPENTQNDSAVQGEETVSVEANKEHDSHLFKLAVTTFLLLLVFGIAYYIYYGMTHTPAAVEESAVVEEVEETVISEEDKLRLLRSLEVADEEDALEVSMEEKRAVLSGLEATEEEEQDPEISEEQKRSLLNSLSAPE